MKRASFSMALIASLLVGQLFINVHASAADIASWQKAVAGKLAKSFRYPRSAIRKGIEGKAVVEVQVDGTGKVLGFNILTPTGETALDREIPKLIKRLDPLPAPPNGEAKNVKLPLTWRLN